MERTAAAEQTAPPTGRGNVFGEDHVAVAVALNNLAGLWRDQGKLDVAARLYERAIAPGRQRARRHWRPAFTQVRATVFFPAGRQQSSVQALEASGSITF